jgi:hypothetical protein
MMQAGILTIMFTPFAKEQPLLEVQKPAEVVAAINHAK